MKHFAKFEKFIPHIIIIPRFMTVRSQMLGLDWGGGGGGGGLFAPCINQVVKIPLYKLGLRESQLGHSVI